MSVLGSLAIGRAPRYLLSWEAADLSLTARTGQVGTYTRSDTQSVGVLDSNGRFGPALPNQPRFVAVDTDGDGVLDAVGLLLEPAATNLVSHPTTLATSPWAVSGTTTATNAAATLAGIAFALVSTATGGTLFQPVTYAADGTKEYRVLIAQDPASLATGTVVVGIQTSTGTTRGSVTGTINSDGTISGIAASVGTLLSHRALADGVYEIVAQATGVVHTDTNRFYADLGTGTATSYLCSGCQTVDGQTPSSLTIDGSRVADVLTFPLLAAPQASTWYIKLIELGTIVSGAANAVLGIGASTNAALAITNNGSGMYEVFHRRSTDVSSTVAAAPSYGQLVELSAALKASGAVQIAQSIAGATETTGTASAANALATAWHDTTLTIGSRGDAGNTGTLAVLAVRVAAGVQSLTRMRAVA